MQFSVGGQQHDPAVLPLRGNSIADPICEAFREGADRRMARNVLRLESQAALADETVSLALDEHRLPEPVELRIFILPTEVPTLHQGMADHGAGRQAGQEGEGLL